MFLSFLFFLLLGIISGGVAIDGLVERDGENTTTIQAPIIATPSEHCANVVLFAREGNDGTWSTFEIRVGNPSIVARVLPATSWQETWVIWSTINACNTSLGVSSDCLEARGGGFDSQSSSTWHDEGEYALGLNTLLGYDGVGDYGFDTVGLGYTNSTGVTLQHQIVAEIQSDTFWFGILGLGFQPTNFSDYGDPQASFSDTLSSNGTIASKSWSYTAGAYYRFKGIFGSLIWGGYDAARFTPNDVVFTMTSDNLRDIVLYIRSITAAMPTGNTTIMSSSEKAFIDSSVTDFWLPISVCQEFERVFSLELDSATGRYLLNSSAHDRLIADNPNITITLSDQASGGFTTDIVLPYASFDLNLSAPFVNDSSRYFPLRQGQNDSMYTLGRAFLQEAYVTADYNTRTFNVSQCLFAENIKSQVIAIPSDMPVPSSGGGNENGNGSGSGNGNHGGNDSDSGKSTGISGGAIAGIVIGSVVLLALIGGILFCCYRRMWCFAGRGERRSSSPVFEIDSGKRVDPNASAYTAQASALTSEVPGQDAKVEIAGNPIMHPQELEAEVPMSAIHKPISPRGHGTSNSSENSTNISSLSQSPEGRPLELQAAGRRPTNDPERAPNFDEEHIVSPTSPTHRDLPGITVSSPTGTHTTWSPDTPVQRMATDSREGA